MPKIWLSNFATLFVALTKISICISAILPNLCAIELNTRCRVGQSCFITGTTQNDTIENNQKFTLNDGHNITFNSSLNAFINSEGGAITFAGSPKAGSFLDFNRSIERIINYGEIGIMNITDMLYSGTSIAIKSSINHIENHGHIAGSIQLENSSGTINLINTGTMGSIAGFNSNQTIIVDNRGSIKNDSGINVISGVDIVIKNYLIRIDGSSNTFTPIKVNVQGKSIKFQDSNSKIILDFGDGFELGKSYDLSKLIIDSNGNSALNIDFSRLTTRNDLYDISNNGNGFSVSIKAQNSAISNLYRANIRAMNNIFVTSNALIYPRKFTATNRTNRTNRAIKTNRPTNRNAPKRVIRKKVSNLNSSDSAESSELFAYNNANLLQSNETFFYDSQDLLADSRAIRLQRLPKNNQRQIYHTNVPRARQTNANKYHFVFMPFVNHNLYANAGDYNLSGLDYGFISAFSGKLNNANALGAHFGFSYGSLGDKNDSAFSIKSANLALGLNYKFDFIWDMFLKARGDFFYLLNEISSSSIAKTKPNNMGFGASVALGKDFDFKNAGVFGAEVGIDYKALSANALSVKSALDNANLQDYSKALYNLIYLDLGANYYKYFSSNVGLWGLSVGAGFRANLAPKLATSKVIVGNNALDMLLDNDKFLGYANLGVSYVLNAQSYAMEFGLSYNGYFGDKAISNGGGFEWRVNF